MGRHRSETRYNSNKIGGMWVQPRLLGGFLCLACMMKCLMVRLAVHLPNQQAVYFRDEGDVNAASGCFQDQFD
jgi:hypothetical protein